MVRRRDWKAITIDWDELSDLDDVDMQSICLTQLEAAILKALLIPAYWASRWNNLSVSLDALQRKIAHIDGQLDGGCAMFRLRQNPDDPCLLEQSFDAGETWVEAFNYKLCQNTDMTNISNQWNLSFVFNTDLEIVYDNDITNVFNDWGYDQTGTDADRDAALCHAITQWVDSICEFLIITIENGNAEVQDQAQFWSDLTFALGGAAIALGAFGVYPLAALFGGTSLLLTSIVVDSIDEWLMEDATPYRDHDARAEVVCEMYLAMQGNTPTYANWSNSLDDALSGNAEKIRTVVDAVNQSEMAFVDWLGLYADMIAIGAGSIGNECDDCQDWFHIWKFDTASGSDPHTTYSDGLPAWAADVGGYFNQGEGGWIATEEDLGAVGTERDNILIYFSTRTVTYLRVKSAYKEGFIAPGKDNLASIVAYCYVGTEQDVINEPFAYQVDGTEEWIWTGSKARTQRIRVMWRCSYSEAEPPEYGDGHVRISEIEIRGKGDCPFD